MENVFTGFQSVFYFFILILTRVTSVLFASPVFGKRTIPPIMKIGLSIMMSYILIGIIPMENQLSFRSIMEFIYICLKEVVIGLCIGYVITLFFSIITVAGHIIDTQIGLGMASIFDPIQSVQMPLTGNYFNIILFLAFFSVNGHHDFIKIIFLTFERIPPGQVFLNHEIVKMIIVEFSMVFMLALKISMPVIAVSLISEAAMGMLVRAVPQMNIFVVGIPLRIALGFIVLFLFTPISVVFLGGMVSNMFGDIEKLIGELVIFGG